MIIQSVYVDCCVMLVFCCWYVFVLFFIANGYALLFPCNIEINCILWYGLRECNCIMSLYVAVLNCYCCNGFVILNGCYQKQQVEFLIPLTSIKEVITYQCSC